MYVCVCMCVSLCLCVCLSVCLCMKDMITQKIKVHLKLEHIVVYENSLDEFDIGHYPINVKVTA